MTPDAAPLSASVPAALRCPQCAREIGHIVERDGAARLRLPDGGTLPEIDYSCACGGRAVWSFSEYRLTRLLKKMERGESG